MKGQWGVPSYQPIHLYKRSLLWRDSEEFLPISRYIFLYHRSSSCRFFLTRAFHRSLVSKVMPRYLAVLAIGTFWLLKVIGMETWTLRAVYQKHLVSFEMWCWRRMEKISWTDRVINKDVYLESRSRGISYKKYVNGRRTGLVTFCVETASYNGLLKER